METFLPVLFVWGSALWLGILTSISPCPLATNIAAISYIGRRVDNYKYVLSAGLLYMIGRTVAYVVLAIFLISSMQSIPFVAEFFQKYMSVILGPLLVLVGIMLLDIIKIKTTGTAISGNFQKFIDKAGIWGAGILGVVFALSFCPVSAGIFFGSLFGLAYENNSRFIIPALYGIGTAIPVMGFAFLIAFSTSAVGKAYNHLTAIEIWVRKITGILIIGIGIYLSLKDIFHVFE